MGKHQLLIDGVLEDAVLTRDVINPATEEPVGQSPCADFEQLDRAVRAAHTAFPAWAATSLATRAAVLRTMADAIDEHADDLARLLTLEQGKPLAAARFEVQRTAMTFRYFAGLTPLDHVDSDGEGRMLRRRRKPLGVVAAIVPWNFPLLLMANKVPPALLAGNTVVLKPAPSTPLTTLLFGALVKDLLPPGVLNVLSDDGPLGAALTTHPLVRKISFTGSTETGKRVMAGAAADLKRITLELGGNDAAIVLADADVKTTAAGVFAGAFRNSGQLCAAVKRVYVHDSIYDAMCGELATLADAAIVGDGLEQGTEFGPIQNRAQYDRVRGLIEDARGTGTIISGAAAVPERGYFVRPTIVRDIADGTRLVDEEQFGPVLPVLRYDEVDDAVGRANATPYGLGASVWSSDRAGALEVAARIDSGVVWINRHPDLAPHLPFSGAKHSGIGIEMGPEGLAEFSQYQLINALEDAPVDTERRDQA